MTCVAIEEIQQSTMDVQSWKFSVWTFGILQGEKAIIHLKIFQYMFWSGCGHGI
jgi:hypothetical protein